MSKKQPLMRLSKILRGGLKVRGLIGSVHIILSVHLFADAVVLGLRWDMIVAVMEHDLSMAETPAPQTKESKNFKVNITNQPNKKPGGFSFRKI